MRTFNQTIKKVLGEGKDYGAGEIYWDDPKFDPNDPTVAIRGYGTMRVSTIESAVARELEDLAKREQKADPEEVFVQRKETAFSELN